MDTKKKIFGIKEMLSGFGWIASMYEQQTEGREREGERRTQNTYNNTCKAII